MPAYSSIKDIKICLFYTNTNIINIMDKIFTYYHYYIYFILLFIFCTNIVYILCIFHIAVNFLYKHNKYYWTKFLHIMYISYFVHFLYKHSKYYWTKFLHIMYISYFCLFFIQIYSTLNVYIKLQL